MRFRDLNCVAAKEFFTIAKEMLVAGFGVQFTVTGSSMWPLLRDKKDSVILSACDEKDLKVGDTVLFSPFPNKYLLHRIVSVTDKTFSTAGDGNCFNDGVFSKDYVIGRVSCYVRNGKKYLASGLIMRLWSFLWRFLFPVRAVLLWGMRKLAILKRR